MKSNAASKTTNHRAACANRQGLSMIEVIVMASVTSMMLVMATSWIHQTIKQSARFRTERREQLAVFRLSQHFRNHVWLSNAVEFADSDAVFLTTPIGDQFTYRYKDQQLHFIYTDTSGKTQAIERFVLPITSNVAFDQASGSRVALRIEKMDGTQGSDQKPRVYQVIKPTLARWLPGRTSLPSNSHLESALDDRELLE